MQAFAQRYNAGCTILIVEDDPFIAFNPRALLSAKGFDVLGPASSVHEALAILEEAEPDAAVLDVKVSGSRVTPLAERLTDKKVPFVIASSLSPEEVEPVLASSPHLGKPKEANQLVSMLQNLTTERRE